MTKDQLRERYLAAMQAYLDEVHKTRMKAMDRDPSGFSEQLRKEEAAEKEYKEAQQAFAAAPWD
jgi:hypothetical protein